MKRTLLIAAAFAAFATSAYAERSTTYQPISSKRSAGYEETQIDANRVRVRFVGTPGAELETVEVNLLYRVAETTLARGYDFFVIVGHNVETRSEYETAGVFGRRGMASYRETPQHKAVADVAMFHGARPPLVANAYDARTVQANLAPRIKRPRQS